MPLDRTWFNTLIDDDGSNTVGTIWNRTSVNAMYVDIDNALLADSPKRSVWTPQVLGDAGQNLIAGGGVVVARYALSGDLLFWTLSGGPLVAPAPTAHFGISTPPGANVLFTAEEQTPVRVHFAGTADEVWAFIEMRPNYMLIKPGESATWAAGTYYLGGQGFYFWR